ncbi:carboxymuconolactone decarboxylase family protein [Cupriavidus basilensis]|uniref:carboxymuconolactone decarboxylase family protein n=1 Tax=Cupriavidus basilensis TaxID=68895 RepID=UPI003D33B160
MESARPGSPRTKHRCAVNPGGRGRTGELKMHIRAALNNGPTRAEIAETFLHASISYGSQKVAMPREWQNCTSQS